MDIIEFLTITRDPKAVHTPENHDDSLDVIFQVYDEIVRSIEWTGETAIPNLIITTSSLNTSQTQLVTLDNAYIVLELTQLNRIANILEFAVGGSKDGLLEYENANSILLGMLSRSEKCAELKGKTRWSNGDPATIRVSTKFQFTTEEGNAILKNRILSSLSHLTGFESLLKPAVAFILFHELIHYCKSIGFMGSFFDRISRSIECTNGDDACLDYIGARLQKAVEIVRGYDCIEEIACDDAAIDGAWKVCIHKWSGNPILFAFTICSLFNSLFFLLLDAEGTHQNFQELFARKILGINKLSFFSAKYIVILPRYSPHVKSNLEMLLGAHETLIEFCNHIFMKRLYEHAVAIGDEVTRHVLADIEMPDVEVSEQDGGGRLPIELVPTEWLEAMVDHHVPIFQLLETPDNPMLSGVIRIKDVNNIDFLEIQQKLNRRNEFINIFWGRP